MEQHAVIMDTDIGTDVDDILALAVLLGSPEVNLLGVTTVYGNVDLRSRMVTRMLELRSIDNIPVHSGIGLPLLNKDPVYWPGHEGVGLLDELENSAPVSNKSAVEFLVETIRDQTAPVTLFPVGPLTNIAAAIRVYPQLVNQIHRIVIMGGRLTVPAGTSNPAEHNIKCDPEAAHIVFESGAPIELVPLDVTLRAQIRRAHVDQLRQLPDGYHQALADQVLRYPPFEERGGSTYLHDPLAALAIVRPDLLTWQEFDISVELRGEYTRGMTVSGSPIGRLHPIRCATDLNVDECEREILRRVMA